MWKNIYSHYEGNDQISHLKSTTIAAANGFHLPSKEHFWYVRKTSPLSFIPISLIRVETNNRKSSICMHIGPASGVLVTGKASELPGSLILKCIHSILLSYIPGKERKLSRLLFLLNLCVTTVSNVLGNESHNKGQNYKKEVACCKSLDIFR